MNRRGPLSLLAFPLSVLLWAAILVFARVL